MNFKALIQTLCTVCLLLLQPAAYAEMTTTVALKNFLAQTHSLTADFKQVLLSESGQPKQTSHGLMYLQRPGKFRWDYQAPFQQQIIANSGKVWFYDSDLAQVTVKKLDESVGAAPALLLSGDINLEDNYSMEAQGSEGDGQWLKLVPKNQDSSFKYLLIGLEKGQLSGMELSDNFGQLTRIYFSNLKLNPPVDSKLFIFQAPPGVDVFAE